MSDEVSAVRVFVTGRVQGVGFRYTAAERARDLELNGWVRNLFDGRVEVFAQGSRANLDIFVSWLDLGPSAAEVTGISVRNAPLRPGFKGFEIRH